MTVASFKQNGTFEASFNKTVRFPLLS